MLIYAARRLLFGGVPLLLIIATITFVLMHAVPGGPWDQEKPLPPQTVANLQRVYHLDQPLLAQYGHFLWDLLHGDLGTSFIQRGTSVWTLIERGLAASALLAAAALAFAVPLGVTFGMLAGRRPGGRLDRATALLAVLGGAVPAFVLAIGLILVFAVHLHWLPAGGWGDLRHLLLPALVLAVLPFAYLARVTRAAVCDVTQEPYVRTAVAKGLPGGLVLRRHILPNALTPPLILMGPLAADLLAGSFIVESIFGIPGVGRLFVQAIFQRDYGVIMGVTLFYAVLILALNLAVDLAQAAIDVRVRDRLLSA